ncbi:MAG: 16S rRNA (cytosine(1402)-N(4))-methyltransferase RsmH [Eubacteriaceae bacterium]|jgi:16S rRNA (cytosine1402-N4)-methyltransferase
MEYKHITVLLEESVNALNIKPDGIYVDATLGGGGHSSAICSRLGPDGTLIGIDQDDFALEYAGKRLESYDCRKILVKSNFEQLGKVLDDLDISGIDGIVYDLGVSSFQLDDDERGFSYHHDGPLDMRMNTESDFSAADLVNTYSKEELIRVLRNYGEERHAGRIASAIIREREKEPIRTTSRLAEIIKYAYPPKERSGKHPARKSFQAIRIEVNRELIVLDTSFDAALAHLNPGGRICVITFHSLEDRIVKNYFREQADPCTCPPDFPVCVCGKKPQIKLITRKPLVPQSGELEHNARARSAKLRIAEKI